MPKSSENVKEFTRLKFKSSHCLRGRNRYKLILCKLFYIDRNFSLIIPVNKIQLFITDNGNHFYSFHSNKVKET